MVFFFFFSATRGSLCTALWPQTAKGIASASDSTHGEAAVGGSRLPARVGEQGGLRPASTTLPTWRQLEEGCCEVRCAATARMPLHLTTHAARAAIRREAGTSAARALASKRMKVAASGAHLPPTSIPNAWVRVAREAVGPEGQVAAGADHGAVLPGLTAPCRAPQASACVRVPRTVLPGDLVVWGGCAVGAFSQ